MNQDIFADIYARLIDFIPEIMGAALIANDGIVLFQAGEVIADEPIIGVAGSAIVRLAEHISSGLSECTAQEISIRCEHHAAFFVQAGEYAILMLVLPAAVDTRTLAGIVQKMIAAPH